MFQMAYNVFTYIKFTLFTRSHPLIDQVYSTTENILLELARWYRFGIDYIYLILIILAKHIVEE